jgi:anti-sigma factor RsiW
MADLVAMMRAWRCRHLAAALVDYSEGVLGPADRERVERHIARCAGCAEAVAALRDLPVLLSRDAVRRDEAFWATQRQQVMERIDAPPHDARRPLPGFDWRLALPVAAAAVIALAGYLSLRAPAKPSEVLLNTLAAEDVAVLVEVADDIVPAQELLLDSEVGSRAALPGALDAGWIRDDEAPTWADLDDEDLEALQGMTG